MKYFSLKIFILCILMPPILYTVSLEFIESHLREQYDTELRNLYMADTSSLLNGNVRLQDAITNIIDRYLESKALLSWADILDE